jgi:hypothetical protein
MPPLPQYLRLANDNQERIELKRGLVSQQAGSSEAEAYLGPLSYTARNSDANASKPPGIIPARRSYPAAHFKAGHMINACFGGNGDKSNNLTILTGSANTSMTIFDNRVKDAVEALRKLYERFHLAKIEVNKIGVCRIRLRVSVSGNKWGDDPPESYIADDVTVFAEFKNSSWDRSDEIQDADNVDNHLDAIDDLETRIENLLAQACGTVDNSY